jgi:hypothetical protein
MVSAQCHAPPAGDDQWPNAEILGPDDPGQWRGY